MGFVKYILRYGYDGLVTSWPPLQLKVSYLQMCHAPGAGIDLEQCQLLWI
jgi:hypothetical protein